MASESGNGVNTTATPDIDVLVADLRAVAQLLNEVAEVYRPGVRLRADPPLHRTHAR